jgi:outer membrane protein assembly factor BamB
MTLAMQRDAYCQGGVQVKRILLTILGCSILASTVAAADWPQWRGPDRTGISQETGLLKEWPKDGPKLLWQVKNIDSGYSTPAVVGDRIYLLSNKGMDDEYVQALSVKEGKQIWADRLGKVGPNKGMNFPGARSTPTIDGELLYTLGSDGDLACLEAASGKIRWHKNLRADFGGQPGTWAYSESPLIDGDTLICTPGGKEATLIALDKHTGNLIWKSALPGGAQAAYASAIVVDSDGLKEYVQFVQKGLVGLDAKTGKPLWQYDKTSDSMGMNIQTPVAQGDKVYSASRRTGGGLVRLEPQNGSVTAAPVYAQRNLPSAIGGAVLVGQYLYGTTGKELVCADFATGKVKWQNPCVGPGSLCYADGYLYVHGENGEVALVEATPEGYRQKGRFAPPDQPKHPRGGMEKSWAYPVVANGRLYVRDQGTLWCYDVKGTGQ